jgi:hypothetical protein
MIPKRNKKRRINKLTASHPEFLSRANKVIKESAGINR